MTALRSKDVAGVTLRPSGELLGDLDLPTKPSVEGRRSHRRSMSDTGPLMVAE